MNTLHEQLTNKLDKEHKQFTPSLSDMCRYMMFEQELNHDIDNKNDLEQYKLDLEHLKKWFNDRVNENKEYHEQRVFESKLCRKKH